MKVVLHDNFCVRGAKKSNVCSLVSKHRMQRLKHLILLSESICERARQHKADSWSTKVNYTAH